MRSLTRTFQEGSTSKGQEETHPEPEGKQWDPATPLPLPPHQAIKLEANRVLEYNPHSVSHAATSGKPNGKENP